MKKIIILTLCLSFLGAGCSLQPKTAPVADTPPAPTIAPLTKETVDLFSATLKLVPADLPTATGDQAKKQALLATSQDGQTIEILPEVRTAALGKTDNNLFFNLLDKVKTDLPYVYFSVSNISASTSTQIFVLDRRTKNFLRDGEIVSLLRTQLTPHNWFLSPSGDRLSIVSPTVGIQIIDLATLQRLQTLAFPKGLSPYEKIDATGDLLFATSTQWTTNDNFQTALYKGAPKKPDEVRPLVNLFTLSLEKDIPPVVPTTTTSTTSTLDAKLKK